MFCLVTPHLFILDIDMISEANAQKEINILLSYRMSDIMVKVWEIRIDFMRRSFGSITLDLVGRKDCLLV